MKNTKTIIIQIGNSDNKLTQEEWHNFVYEVNDLICTTADKIYFAGGPSNYSLYQNAAWITEYRKISKMRLDIFSSKLKELKEKYKQDSIAWTEGITTFI
jgi:hypothetical protein